MMTENLDEQLWFCWNPRHSVYKLMESKRRWALKMINIVKRKNKGRTKNHEKRFSQNMPIRL